MLKNEMDPEKLKMIESKWKDFRDSLDEAGVGILIFYGHPSDGLLFYDRKIRLKSGNFTGYITPVVNLAKIK
jgi:hypothetical protein